MGVTGFAELTLESEDHESLARFYAEVLGLPELAREDDRIWLAAGERARLGVWSPGEKDFGDRGGRHVHYAFRVEPGTLDRLVDRVRGHGRDVHGPVEHPGGDRSIYVEDPDGNVLEAWDFFERGEGARDGVEALDE